MNFVLPVFFVTCIGSTFLIAERKKHNYKEKFKKKIFKRRFKIKKKNIKKYNLINETCVICLDDYHSKNKYK
jgi:hypothetical protein